MNSSFLLHHPTKWTHYYNLKIMDGYYGAAYLRLVQLNPSLPHTRGVPGMNEWGGVYLRPLPTPGAYQGWMNGGVDLRPLPTPGACQGWMGGGVDLPPPPTPGAYQGCMGGVDLHPLPTPGAYQGWKGGGWSAHPTHTRGVPGMVGGVVDLRPLPTPGADQDLNSSGHKKLQQILIFLSSFALHGTFFSKSIIAVPKKTDHKPNIHLFKLYCIQHVCCFSIPLK